MNEMLKMSIALSAIIAIFAVAFGEKHAELPAAAADDARARWEFCATDLWRAEVPGGWVYAYGSGSTGNGKSLCFVPRPASATAVPG